MSKDDVERYARNTECMYAVHVTLKALTNTREDHTGKIHLQYIAIEVVHRRRGDLMVTALDSASSGSGSSPGQTLHSVSLLPGV